MNRKLILFSFFVILMVFSGCLYSKEPHVNNNITAPEHTFAKPENESSSIKIGQIFGESGGIKKIKWDGDNFSGFWHDQETNMSTETLIIKKSIQKNRHRIIEKQNLIYTTKSVLLNCCVYAHDNTDITEESGSYSAIGWQGEKYAFLPGNRLSKILFEQNPNQTKTMTSGESWNFDEGYRILVNSVDVMTVRQVWFSFFKDDRLIVDVILGENDFYIYPENTNNVPVFIIHASNYRSTPESDIVDFNCVWLRSQDLIEIKENEIFGKMEVTSIQNGTIELRNIVPINLAPEILGKWVIQTDRNAQTNIPVSSPFDSLIINLS